MVEDRIVVPSDRVLALLKWAHKLSGHTTVCRSLSCFKQWFHITWNNEDVYHGCVTLGDPGPLEPGAVRAAVSSGPTFRTRLQDHAPEFPTFPA